MAERTRVRALCCQCGALRMVAVTGGILTGEPPAGEAAEARCTMLRKCAPCGVRTVHAFLRDSPDEAWRRDSAELSPEARHEQLRQHVLDEGGCDIGPASPDALGAPDPKALRRELLEEVERLRGCQFRVAWVRTGWEPDEVARLVQYLDDGVFYIELNHAFGDQSHLQVLRSVWSVAMERSGAHWLVQSASLDDPDSVPYRATTFLAVPHDARH